MAHLSARADTAYQNDYHHKLRGRLWDALADTKYDRRHDDGEPPGFAYSNPFPPHDMEAGDDRKLLVASPEEELLAQVAADLLEEPELNIGEMPFYVDDITSLSPDVGEPGTRGTIETGTGLLVRIPPWRCEEYGIDHPGGETAVFWRPKHSMAPLRKQLEDNLDQKHDRFAHDHLPGPSDVDGDLFDGYELIKTFAVPVTVTEGQEMTYVLSKWKFEYTVQDDHHRRHLNLALDCGLGERNSLGLGFVNITDKTPPGKSELEGRDAFT
ncbi:CRISPR-associated endoribonuclease Cas6 [Haloarcula salinisoli]|uniref:CRISPR-associated endoribonuclease Cas6 n=1 Tax=Haloarcula salinisoli TaxID=2487746 RepID=A0A8J7YGR2_9EURY|nr:CRISPR-associated endoribonuclease Cas6 [Halomicroarcula salinisoli]MBX0305715.1 CRISPR-associated endoribonuclease Cas6 [Halomicroarcula salinisoli]